MATTKYSTEAEWKTNESTTNKKKRCEKNIFTTDFGLSG